MNAPNDRTAQHVTISTMLGHLRMLSLDPHAKILDPDALAQVSQAILQLVNPPFKKAVALFGMMGPNWRDSVIEDLHAQGIEVLDPRNPQWDTFTPAEAEANQPLVNQLIALDVNMMCNAACVIWHVNGDITEAINARYELIYLAAKGIRTFAVLQGKWIDWGPANLLGYVHTAKGSITMVPSLTDAVQQAVDYLESLDQK